MLTDESTASRHFNLHDLRSVSHSRHLPLPTSPIFFTKRHWPAKPEEREPKRARMVTAQPAGMGQAPEPSVASSTHAKVSLPEVPIRPRFWAMDGNDGLSRPRDLTRCTPPLFPLQPADPTLRHARGLMVIRPSMSQPVAFYRQQPTAPPSSPVSAFSPSSSSSSLPSSSPSSASSSSFSLSPTHFSFSAQGPGASPTSTPPRAATVPSQWAPDCRYRVFCPGRGGAYCASTPEDVLVDCAYTHQYISQKVFKLADTVARRDVNRALGRVRRAGFPGAPERAAAEQVKVLRLVAAASKRPRLEWAEEYALTLARAQRHFRLGSPVTSQGGGGTFLTATMIDETVKEGAGVIDLVRRRQLGQKWTPDLVLDVVWAAWLDETSRQLRHMVTELRTQTRENLSPVHGPMNSPGFERRGRLPTRQTIGRPVEYDIDNVSGRAMKTSPARQPWKFVALKGMMRLSAEGFTPEEHFVRYNREPDTTWLSSEDFVKGFGQLADGDDDNDDDDGDDDGDENNADNQDAADIAPMPTFLHHNPCVELIAKVTAARTTMERASA